MIANSQQRRRSTFETNILKFFFLERASTSNFCCATNQNNPHILKYVSYDRSRLLQPCGKLFSWAPPVPLGNFYPLAPPPPRNFHWPSVGGYGYFLESHIRRKLLLVTIGTSRVNECTCTCSYLSRMYVTKYLQWLSAVA